MSNKVHVTEYFHWLFERIKSKGKKSERWIIYCQTVNQCSTLFSIFSVCLGSKIDLNEENQNLKERLVEMMHARTPGNAVLWKIRRSLPLDQRKLYYNAMIKQTMPYASTVWTSCSAKHASHVILNVDTKANSVQLFRELDMWMTMAHLSLNWVIRLWNRRYCVLKQLTVIIMITSTTGGRCMVNNI